jgi:hypothetical protein
MRIWDAFLPSRGEPRWIASAHFGESISETEVRRAFTVQRGPLPGLLLTMREIPVLEGAGDIGRRRSII